MKLIKPDGTLNKNCFLVIASIRIDKMSISELVELYKTLSRKSKDEIASMFYMTRYGLNEYIQKKLKDESHIKERLMSEIVTIMKER